MFIIEDGSVVPNANAYISVAEFRDFHGDRGLSAAQFDTGLYTEALVQTYIVKATDYVDKRFNMKFKGFQKEQDQSLQWPRLNVFNSSGRWIDSNTIPIYLKRGICEYAYLVSKLLDLLPTPSPNFNRIDLATGEIIPGSSGPLLRNVETIGPLTEEQWYGDRDPARLEEIRAAAQLSDMVSSINLPEYPRADAWLSEIIEVGGTINLTRA
jgi:hypothetical protein